MQLELIPDSPRRRTGLYIVAGLFIAASVVGAAISRPIVREKPTYHFDYATTQCRDPGEGEIRGTFEWCDQGRCSKRCSVMPLNRDDSAARSEAKLKKKAFIETSVGS